MSANTCPECGSSQLFRSVPTATWGSREAGATIFPGLGTGWAAQARFTVVACKDCGLSRLYLSHEGREQLGSSDSWRRVIG
jgi:predicted nucleic-acid-binding Zn-ribbon protein